MSKEVLKGEGKLFKETSVGWGESATTEEIVISEIRYVITKIDGVVKKGGVTPINDGRIKIDEEEGEAMKLKLADDSIMDITLKPNLRF